MKYIEIHPQQALSDFVKCYWWFDNPASQPVNHTILPDGNFDLIVFFKNRQLEGIILTGLWTKPVDVSIDPLSQLFGIRFKPLAASHVFHRSLSTIRDSHDKLDTGFWSIDHLDFADLEKTAERLNIFLCSLVDNEQHIDQRRCRLFQILEDTTGARSVEEYAQRAFLTSRQINRYFNSTFGLSLKAYCNILRCFASFEYIKDGRLFPEQAFYDQSHFIKELKKHTGSTPTNLYQNKNDRFLQLTTSKKK
jgi:AraC-like DNA-binding protein